MVAKVGRQNFNIVFNHFGFILVTRYSELKQSGKLFTKLDSQASFPAIAAMAIDARCTTCYNMIMIKSWQHKGLKKFYETGSKPGINPDHARRLKVLLQLLNAANAPECMDAPGFDFHRLKANLSGFYSVAVRANWKLIFQFDGEDAILVDYLDYH